MSEKISLYGTHAVTQFLKSHPEYALELYLQEGKAGDKHIPNLKPYIDSIGLKLIRLDKQAIDDKCSSAHQGVVLMSKAPPTKTEKQLMSDIESLMREGASPFLLILDGITDPHNLGACLRSANAAGVNGVIVPKDNSAKLNATVRKVAAGAAELMPFYVVTNLARNLDKLKEQGIWLAGTTLSEGAKSIYDTDLTGPLAIVMGSEGKGLRRLSEEKCDFLTYIPMRGQVQSMNVSVAAGVSLFEALRQRQQGPS